MCFKLFRRLTHRCLKEIFSLWSWILLREIKFRAGAAPKRGSASGSTGSVDNLEQNWSTMELK